MNRKTFLIQMLVLLFTFQNVWNVAEAACLHEVFDLQNSTLIGSSNLIELVNNEKQVFDSVENYNEIYDYCQKLCFNEKCNHLANTTVIQIDPAHDLQPKTNFRTRIIPFYSGITFYKSPYLNQLTPPPDFSPLSVG